RSGGAHRQIERLAVRAVLAVDPVTAVGPGEVVIFALAARGEGEDEGGSGDAGPIRTEHQSPPWNRTSHDSPRYPATCPKRSPKKLQMGKSPRAAFPQPLNR